MPTKSFAIYSASDIIVADIPDGSKAITVALSATPEIVTIDANDFGQPLGPRQALFSGKVAGQPFDNEVIFLLNETNLLGSGGVVFDVQIGADARNAGFGFSFAPAPGVTYFTTPVLPDTNPEQTAPLIGYPGDAMVKTNDADMPLQGLAPGQMIWTLQNGLQPLRWLGRIATLSQDFVRFQAGTFGAKQNLALPRLHQILFDGPEVELLFGEEAVFVCAQDLVNGTNVTVVNSPAPAKTLLPLFDRVEIIEINGLRCQSFTPDPASLSRLSAAQRQEALASLAPDALENMSTAPPFPMLRPHETALLMH